MEKICVIGLGYIGLPTATFFAKSGLEIVGVDVNEQVVSLLNQGEIMIEEIGLPEAVKKAVEDGHLRASTVPENADAFIIAVPTPMHEENLANLEYVIDATRSIGPFLKKGNIVIVESTIPPRTMDDVVSPIIKEYGLDPNKDVYLAHCPERVLPGKILTELVENTRIVGGTTPLAAKKAADVYRKITKGKVIETEAITAEMSKLVENTFRDVNIAFANELVKVSQKIGVDAHKVIELANMHPRVNIHQPGPGVGGHCLAIDPYFIVEKAQQESKLIQTAREINNSMPKFVVEQINRLTIEISNPKIAVLGLTYKGNIDDIRESPALEIYHRLAGDKRYIVRAFDPHVRQEQVPFTLHDFTEAIIGAHVAVILADHDYFKTLTANDFSSMASPIIFDTKNCIYIEQDAVKVYKIGDLAQINAIQIVD